MSCPINGHETRIAPRFVLPQSQKHLKFAHFFVEMAAFRCFARHKVMFACASAARMAFCRLSHRMAVGESRKFNPARGLQKPENMLQ